MSHIWQEEMGGDMNVKCVSSINMKYMYSSSESTAVMRGWYYSPFLSQFSCGCAEEDLSVPLLRWLPPPVSVPG